MGDLAGKSGRVAAQSWMLPVVPTGFNARTLRIDIWYMPTRPASSLTPDIAADRLACWRRLSGVAFGLGTGLWYFAQMVSIPTPD
jgi:hypothetical protein